MIYLDNAATTKPRKEVIKILAESAENDFINPSSLHTGGLEVSNKIENARETITKLINTNYYTNINSNYGGSLATQQLIFTSGGTEANNMAINSAKGDIITAISEHDSVLAPIERKKGTQKVDYVKVNKYAKVDIDSLQSLLSENTSFISIMHTNNELGTINDIDEIGKIIKTKTPKAIFHVDGVSAFAKENVSLKYVDIFTFSSHKINGPKGVGCIWAKNGKIIPMLFGGSQEKKIRPGTENTNGIIAFAKAAEIAFSEKDKNKEHVYNLKKEFIKKLENLEIKHVINSPENASPYVLNLSFLGLKAQVLVNALSNEKIYLSTGAACSAREKRNTLKNLGLSNELSETAIRISFSHENTLEEMQTVANKIKEISNYLIIK
ncbi:MAG: cysteine desulfurase [Defluviitaleaceae bacterium]|nr:cysteine desulfurase [Defluviitaleaceae bacterium]